MPLVALLIVLIVLIAMATTRASVHLSHSFQPILMAPFQPRVNKTVMAQYFATSWMKGRCGDVKMTKMRHE